MADTVDEVIKKWKKVRDMYSYQSLPKTGLDIVIDEVERLRAELQRLDMAGIHSCHDDCHKLPCVQRREIERLRAEVEMAHSFHRVAVKERDFERLLVETLKEELAAAKAASVLPVEVVDISIDGAWKRGCLVDVLVKGREKEGLEFVKWLRDRMKDTTTPAT